MKVLRRHRGGKGVATILVVGVLGVFLIFFLVVGIDFAYMYVVRGQMQNAADAAALAGAVLLDGTNDVAQPSARQEAWEFACKNFAAGDPVYLVSGAGSECDAPPSNLNDLNADGGDIIVGNWDPDRPPDEQGFIAASIVTGVGFPINAVKVVARRTADSPGTGGPVSLFFGHIVDWPVMGVSRLAIAAKKPPFIAPLPICLPSCDLTAPIDGQWGYDPIYDEKKCEDDPESHYCGFAPGGIPAGYTPQDSNRLCTPSTTGPVGQRFYLSPSSKKERPSFAWTNFDIIDISACDSKAKCNDNPDGKDIPPYILGKEPPDICGKAICITNGLLAGPVLKVLRSVFEEKKKDYTVGEQTVNGWFVTMPVVLDCSGSQPCPSDPTGRPYPVNYFAQLIITEVISSGGEGKKGIRLVGLNNPETITYTCREKDGGGYEDITRTRIVTTIGDESGECLSCALPPEESPETTARLVK